MVFSKTINVQIEGTWCQRQLYAQGLSIIRRLIDERSQ